LIIEESLLFVLKLSVTRQSGNYLKQSRLWFQVRLSKRLKLVFTHFLLDIRKSALLSQSSNQTAP